MTSEHDLVTYLRRERSARGLSMRALAERARVSKSTIGAWEKGTHQPSLYELDAVLGVFGAEADERVRILGLIDAPRARREVQRTPGGTLGVALATAGAMLQAMRIRRGFSYAELGRRIGAAPTTIGRWERGDAWPSPSRLETTLNALNAQTAERAALEAVHSGRQREPSLDETKAFLEAFHHERWGRTLPPFIELHLIALVDTLWPLVQRSRVAEELYRDACGCLASAYLLNHGALSEAVSYAQRALAGDDGGVKEPLTVWPAHIVAKGMAASGRTADQVRAVEYLRSWIPRMATNVHVANWYRRDIAEFVAQAGEIETALNLSRQAIDATIAAGKPADEARYDHARLLMQAGRGEEALPLLPAPVETLPLPTAKLALTWGEAMMLTRERDAATRYLERAERIIETNALTILRPQMRALATNLGRVA